MDFIVSFPRRKNNKDGILNFVDRLSKMIRLIPITKDIFAPGVAKIFKEHIYRHHGLLQCNALGRRGLWPRDTHNAHTPGVLTRVGSGSMSQWQIQTLEGELRAARPHSTVP